jgi:hypothetical protein
MRWWLIIDSLKAIFGRARRWAMRLTHPIATRRLQALLDQLSIARFGELPEEERQQALKMYARPVLNWLAYKGKGVSILVS